jgi:hypothetical protein
MRKQKLVSTWNPIERKLWKEYYKLQYWKNKQRRGLIEKWYWKVKLYVPENILFAKGV